LLAAAAPRKTPRLAALYATEFNIGFRSIDSIAEVFANVRAVCEEEGRDPATLQMSVALPTIVGRDADEVARRCVAAGIDPNSDHSERLVGTPEQVVHRLLALKALGTDRTYLQTMDMTDLEHLDLIAAEVLPHVS
jgi:alkanesulfonate monooxygenase SsuD/methylene tetrahydromethanopterin reductase-like flavin-dependent oxidoreductase (luciferase family)